MGLHLGQVACGNSDTCFASRPCDSGRYLCCRLQAVWCPIVVCRAGCRSGALFQHAQQSQSSPQNAAQGTRAAACSAACVLQGGLMLSAWGAIVWLGFTGGDLSCVGAAVAWVLGPVLYIFLWVGLVRGMRGLSTCCSWWCVSMLAFCGSHGPCMAWTSMSMPCMDTACAEVGWRIASLAAERVCAV